MAGLRVLVVSCHFARFPLLGRWYDPRMRAGSGIENAGWGGDMNFLRAGGRLCAAGAFLSVAACGGGGNGPMTVLPTTPSIPQVYVRDAGPIIFATQGSAGPELMKFPQATGTAPNFTNSYPAAGTVFPLLQTVLDVAWPNAVGNANTQGATLTVTGTQMVGGVAHAVLEFKIPSLGVDATGLIGDGNAVTLADGRKLTFWAQSLSYTALGAWNITPIKAGSTAGDYQFGIGLSGYQTPAANVPTGTATYVGNGTNGGAWGHVASPDGTGGIFIASVEGSANIAINFSSGSVSGSLTNMSVETGAGKPSVPWNDVSLTGSMSGSTLSGTTASTGAVPTGNSSFAAGSSGNFSGALFGPNGEELGAVWTLHDATGQGKSAIGYLAATK
jgi:hypothetical protein